MTYRIAIAVQALALALALAPACSSNEGLREPEDFHTSGSREADQRAEQRILKDEQLRSSEDGALAQPTPVPLFERLGGEEGVQLIVADFVDRVLVDPRANWKRQGVKSGGFFGLGGKSIDWRGDPKQVERLKLRLVQFISVAAGGPATYEGRGMAEVHKGMKITNAEFDATIGALKASLDKLEVPLTEQKELLALFESTRPQVATKR
jgi:hemoglobin